MISVRALEPADAPVVASWIDGPEALVTWSGNTLFTWPFDGRQLLGLSAADPDRRLMVATGPDGTPVGHFGLRAQPGGRSVRLGMVLVAPSARGRGRGAAMVAAAVGAAFADPRVERVELGVYAHNERARRIYERLGFREGEEHPRSVEVGGAWWTSTTMILPRDAWRPSE
ncbi:GNAT family N-acetyltransferase [Nonomuraea roseoviolacea]|uniref:RimJ/RimL family protein N-acetyltransferase n=1 Tax=Nonomuraea roseoviolacea subsp. carminata TaxID=160689 RepID=A0ABT1JRZ4_9ACTN|nr:GNAT family protein [Nonomuraea roseoviolacea]MCP2344513.1 RimJ/RimL family protein N-acetyltransferase [Nonomuraea roseoviolacea subsp. carminata]